MDVLSPKPNYKHPHPHISCPSLIAQLSNYRGAATHFYGKTLECLAKLKFVLKILRCCEVGGGAAEGKHVNSVRCYKFIFCPPSQREGVKRFFSSGFSQKYAPRINISGRI